MRSGRIVSSDATSELFGIRVGRIHAVGVGGMGLGPLAIYLAQCGWSVSGEDDALQPPMAEQLERAGVRIVEPHQLPDDTELLVYSSAIPEAHPTRKIAKNRSIPEKRRGELLAEISKGRHLVAVAGSHGKTTVTAMLIHALDEAGLNCDYIVGGLLSDTERGPARGSDADWLVAEVDESDGTLEGFRPVITVVVNLDWDHADYYQSPKFLEDAFRGLLERTSEVVLVGNVGEILPGLIESWKGSADLKTFGFQADFQLVLSTSIGSQEDGMTLKLSGDFVLSEATVRARGTFNSLNATAALAAVQLMGGSMRSGLLDPFEGVRRRQGVLWRDDFLTVMEDYAHHPAEIRELLSALREDLDSDRRLVVVFQPHRYSRTRQFRREFAEVLLASDQLHLLDVYSAGETLLVGGSTADLLKEIQIIAPQRAINYVSGNSAAVLNLLTQARRPGDLVVFVGAGDIENHARSWVEAVKSLAAARSSWDVLATALKQQLAPGTKISRDELLGGKTTMRVGGAARVYLEPESLTDLQTVLRICAQKNASVHFLGRGSNLVIPDAGVEGVVISLRHSHWASFAVEDDGAVKVGAGLRLKNLCGLAAKAGLSGFEFLEGVPGNVGGALRMNAGAMGGWMFDMVESVQAVTIDGDVRHMPREDLHVGYRHCAELEDMMAVGSVLRPNGPSASDEVARQIDVYRGKRQESQPREPSAGCIFKNPEGDSAGRLIDSCELKGTRMGDAEVSTVHGNFIVNRGRAASSDVVSLVRHVRGTVNQKTGVWLQPEVLLYGANWEDLL